MSHPDPATPTESYESLALARQQTVLYAAWAALMMSAAVFVAAVAVGAAVPAALTAAGFATPFVFVAFWVVMR